MTTGIMVGRPARSICVCVGGGGSEGGEVRRARGRPQQCDRVHPRQAASPHTFATMAQASTSPRRVVRSALSHCRCRPCGSSHCACMSGMDEPSGLGCKGAAARAATAHSPPCTVRPPTVMRLSVSQRKPSGQQSSTAKMRLAMAGWLRKREGAVDRSVGRPVGDGGGRGGEWRQRLQAVTARSVLSLTSAAVQRKSLKKRAPAHESCSEAWGDLLTAPRQSGLATGQCKLSRSIW